MPLRIMTNEQAITAQRHLELTNQRLNAAMEKLSSGHRINHASDDAAGLAISDTIHATIRSMGQAIRNAQDGISLIQVFEGGTSEVNNIMMRMRELSMESATDTVGDRERGLIDNEFQELKLEIERISRTTKYAGKILLDGSTPNFEIQVGVDNDPERDRISFDPSEADLRITTLGIESLSISEKEGAQASLESLDKGMARVNTVRSQIGSIQSRLQSTANVQRIFEENLQAARSRIYDTDVALESTNLAKETIIRNSGVAMLGSANQMPAVALNLIRQQ